MIVTTEAPPAPRVAPPAPPRARPTATLRHVALLVALSLALNLYGIDWGLPNGPYDWSNDSVAPLEPLAYAKRMLHREPWTSKYPPLHFTVLAAAYAPYLGYLKLTGGLGRPAEAYPWGFADPERSLMVLTLIARLVSVLMGVGLVVATYATVRRLAGARAGLIAGALVATSLPIVHYAHNANVDVPHLFWTALALWSFVALLQTWARRHAVLLGLFTAAAVGTKDSIYALFVGVALVLLGVHARRLRRTAGVGAWLTAPATRHLALGLVAFLLGLVVVFNVPLNWRGVGEHVQRHLRQSVGGSQVIEAAPSRPAGELALLGSYVTFLYEANAAPVFALLVLGLGWALVRARPLALMVLVPTATYYLLFLRVHGTHHLRYVLPVYLLLTWPAAHAAAAALEGGALRRALVTAALGLALGWGALEALSVGVLYSSDPRYRAEAWMRAHLPTGASVLAVTPNYTLPRFPAGLRVTRRELWDWDGQQVADITDVAPDWVVIGMGLPRRRAHAEAVDGFFRERGYRRHVEFVPAGPPFGREVADLHSLHPRIVVYARAGAPEAFAARGAGGEVGAAGGSR